MDSVIREGDMDSVIREVGYGQCEQGWGDMDSVIREVGYGQCDKGDGIWIV